jgi:hypothetical protein
MKTKCKSIIRAACHSFVGVVCPAVVMLIASSAQAQNLFVASYGGGIIYEFTPGGVQSTFASVSYPGGMAFDSTGNLFVAGYANGNIYKITPGGVQNTFALGVAGIQALAFDSASNLYATVVNGPTNGVVYKFTPGGVRSTFASGLPEPYGLAFNGAGVLFVAEGGNNTIDKFSPGGVRSTFASVPLPYGLVFDSASNLFVGGNFGNIYKITPGGVQSTFASGLINASIGMAFDSAGNLFVGQGGSYNGQSGSIIEYAPDGTQSTFASGLYPPGTLAFQPGSVPSIQLQNTTNKIGDNVSLTVLITGGTAQDLHWYFSGTNFDSGTNSSIIITNIQQPYFGNYYVIGTNTSGSFASSVASIYEPVAITSQPTNLIVSSLSPATFSVSAIGYPAPNYYQWTLNGTNMAGGNSNTLTIASVTLQNTGNYQVLVSNTISSTVSSMATLNMSPSITSPFIGASAIWGRSATISVGAIGNGTLTYQWYLNGVAIAGATDPEINFASIQFTNNGFYSVVISSPYGSVSNVAAQVTVNPACVALGFYPGLIISGVAGYSYIIQSSADLTKTNNWNTLTNLTLTQPVQIWVDTSVDASSPFNNKYFYQVLPGQ